MGDHPVSIPYALVFHPLGQRGFRLFVVCCFSVLVILTDALYFISLWKSKTTDYFKRLEQNNRQYIAQELEYFRVYKKSQDELRRFRHDMTHHFAMLAQLCERNDLPAAQTYLREVQKSWNAVAVRLYHTGDDTVDAILNAKVPQMEKSQIHFALSGAFAGPLPLSAFDLCSIFANALDNAIEANQKISGTRDRSISLFIGKSNFYYRIVLENAMPENQPYTGQTTKADPANHGFGLRSIREKVRQSGGTVTISADGRRFRLELLLPH